MRDLRPGALQALRVQGRNARRDAGTISETLLAEGRTRVAGASGPREALEALVEWHIEFALEHRALIVVQDRDWSNLPDEARERVRAFQRAYVDIWATEVRRLEPGLSPEASRTRAHVLFGLLNSTPHSGRLPDPQMHDVLRDMATGWSHFNTANTDWSYGELGRWELGQPRTYLF